MNIAKIDAYRIVLTTISSTKSRALNFADTNFNECLNAIKVSMTATIDLSTKLIFVDVS